MSTMSEPSELELELLTRFAEWVRRLGEDVLAFATELESLDTAPPVRLALASGLNYVIKSIDLIDDGIESLGYLDDAMVLRVALTGAHGAIPESLQGMRGDSGLLSEFLGALAPRMERFVAGLAELSVRGRSARQELENPELLSELLLEVRGFASRYKAPAFPADPSLLIRAHAFLDAKLPKD
jgi:uncharacterized membrane protein YkvA (DUF1232 family)